MHRLLIWPQMKGDNTMINNQTGETTHHSPHQQQDKDNELETLKREVERLQALEDEISKSSKTAGNVTKGDTSAPPESEHLEESCDHRKVAMDFESVLQEMEAVAKDRPALALLVAFSVGVVVGQIFSRR